MSVILAGKFDDSNYDNDDDNDNDSVDDNASDNDIDTVSDNDNDNDNDHDNDDHTDNDSCCYGDPFFTETIMQPWMMRLGYVFHLEHLLRYHFDMTIFWSHRTNRASLQMRRQSSDSPLSDCQESKLLLHSLLQESVLQDL